MQNRRTDKQAAAFVPVYAAVRHRAPALTLPSRLQRIPMICFLIYFLFYFRFLSQNRFKMIEDE